MGKRVIDGIADALGPNHLMPFQDRQMLGKQGGFQRGVAEDLADAGRFRVGGQYLQDADAGGVGQCLEEVRLDLVERLLVAVGEAGWHGTSSH